MADHEITLAGVAAVLDRAGALFLPEDRVLVVADLHFEKGSAHAARGLLLPPYDTRATLDRLARVIAARAAATVICLGDSFHDRGAGERLGADDLEAITALMAGRNWIWISGNHDPETPPQIGGDRAREIALGPLCLRHQPTAGPMRGEIAGHLHPKAAVVRRGRRITRPCFASDGERMILPAFGAFTGGLNVRHRAFAKIFPGPFHAHMLGRDHVRAVPSARLS